MTDLNIATLEEQMERARDKLDRDTWQLISAKTAWKESKSEFERIMRDYSRAYAKAEMADANARPVPED